MQAIVQLRRPTIGSLTVQASQGRTHRMVSD